MRPNFVNLSSSDRAAHQVLVEFLRGRLSERETIEWALRLTPRDYIKRLALLHVIESPDGREIGEPWRSAWRIIEKSWERPFQEETLSPDEYDARNRLQAGDRSMSLVAMIVGLVQPQLDVHILPIRHNSAPPKSPKAVSDLLGTSLTSGQLHNPAALGLEQLFDRIFLVSLANALNAAVMDGLNISRHIEIKLEPSSLRLGGLYRVYYAFSANRNPAQETDQFHKGIAPSVKLLHAVVSRLAQVDVASAIEFVRRWRSHSSPIHLRLWAAMSRDPRVTSGSEVGATLTELDQRRFWDVHNYPEIAELRAVRFRDLDDGQQKILVSRIRNRPPRNHWPKGDDLNKVNNARLYWAVRELKRIEIAGIALKKQDKDWLAKQIEQFPDLVQMSRIDDGFLRSYELKEKEVSFDNSFDILSGEMRLRALESDLSSARVRWDNPAHYWINNPGNTLKILADLESARDGGGAFPAVWEDFGWAHAAALTNSDDSDLEKLTEQIGRILALLDKLPVATIRNSIGGISRWFSATENLSIVEPNGPTVWLRLWPIAVEVANAGDLSNDSIVLDAVQQSADDQEALEVDTLNTPAGRLVGVFIAALPTIQQGDRPFEGANSLREMRDAVVNVTGHAKLIALHRMIEQLPYFLLADENWTRKHLVAPLKADNSDAIGLWFAVARRTRFKDVLQIIGDQMCVRATDTRLNRETRHSLVFSVVVETLHSYYDVREPAVFHSRVQQMIRSLDDEGRAFAAEAIPRFIQDVSEHPASNNTQIAPEVLFRGAAKPFLEKVWPQERSISTPSVSKALARLPAAAKEAFDEAVLIIERFLVPFASHSMVDFGLFGQVNDRTKLSLINDYEKASAFLKLLDRTIETSIGSLGIPYDLADALGQIKKAAPKLSKAPEYRRLATAARS